MGNGFCNDETNNADCNYDGGECCVVNASTNSCSECGCHFIETCAAGYHPLIRNGFCDDVTNVADCHYDGGDCCDVNANKDYCSECVCHLLETCTAGYHPLVGNGFCDDETNVAGCYDGGECCGYGYNINWEHCTECTCFIQETCLAGVHPLVGNGFCDGETNIDECEYDGGECCFNVGNGYCDDDSNTPGCNYDGGDCCGSCVNKEYCSTCTCLDGGSINSFANNLNFIGNGFCDDGLNNAECQFDGGDCCGPSVNTNFCTLCTCKSSGKK